MSINIFSIVKDINLYNEIIRLCFKLEPIMWGVERVLLKNGKEKYSVNFNKIC